MRVMMVSVYADQILHFGMVKTVLVARSRHSLISMSRNASNAWLAIILQVPNVPQPIAQPLIPSIFKNKNVSALGIVLWRKMELVGLAKLEQFLTLKLEAVLHVLNTRILLQIPLIAYVVPLTKFFLGVCGNADVLMQLLFSISKLTNVLNVMATLMPRIINVLTVLLAQI